MKAIKRVFYGWKIVAASIVILAVGLGMFNSTNSVFVKPICDSLGFARSEFTLYRTIIMLVSAGVMPFYSKVIRRLGTKKTLLLGSIMLGLITVGYSFASELWHFYTLAFFNGFFFNAVNFMVIGILINAWFEDKKGFATGIAYSGSGIGGAIMIPIVGALIESTDWRFAFQFIGVLGTAILVPVILLFIKDLPERMGLEPYISSKEGQKKQVGAESNPLNLSFRKSLKTSRFWLLTTGLFFISFFAGGTNTHSTPFLSDLGYSIAFVSTAISLMMLFLTVGKILLGIIYDRFGTLFGAVFISVCCLIFPVAALLSSHPVFPWVYAVSVGIACCGLSVPVSVLINKYFGMRDFAAIFSFFTMMSTLAPAISVPVMGAVYDNTGTYQFAWIMLLVFSVIITACMVGAELTYRRAMKLKS